MQSNRPRIEGVYETVVYGGGAATFYERVLGLRPVGDVNDLFTTFRLPDGGTLLVVDPTYASTPGA